MTQARAAWLLGAAAWLLLPLPYFIVANGRVPVVRIAFLSAISVAYAIFIDGSGVAWPVACILLAHVAVYTILLAIGAAIIARLIPPTVRRTVIWTCITAGFAAAFFLDIYVTPFDDAFIHANWFGLFQ